MCEYLLIWGLLENSVGQCTQGFFLGPAYHRLQITFNSVRSNQKCASCPLSRGFPNKIPERFHRMSRRTATGPNGLFYSTLELQCNSLGKF